MSKVDTDQGLGPGSERMRREVREAQKELESRGKEKAAAAPVDKNAVTEPGVGKVERRADTVDDLLGGFGPSRPDLPRILPKADTTPPPEPVRKELTPTEPGKRQRQRNTILMIVTFLLVAAGGIAIVKMSSNGTSSPQPTATATATVTATATATTNTQPTETVTPIATMPIEALPTVKTAAPVTTTSAKSVHSATTAATTTTTATSPRPTGTAPPGLNLFPDDPHR